MFENISHFLFSCTRVANQTDNKWDVLSWKSFALTIELVVWVCGFAKDFYAVDDAMMLRCWKFEMILSLFALVSLPLALWKWKILVGVASMRKSQMRKDEKKISKFSQWKIHSLHSLFCVVFRIIKVFLICFVSWLSEIIEVNVETKENLPPGKSSIVHRLKHRPGVYICGCFAFKPKICD